jgi:hypothetical protein
VTNNGSAPVSSKGYELLVREILQQMLDQDRALNVVVQHIVQKQGRATVHQIDVYWEFCIGGVTHKVTVQAKRWKNQFAREMSSRLRVFWKIFWGRWESWSLRHATRLCP